MEHRIKDIPDSYHNVKRMFKGIPRQIWHIFFPESDEGFARLETNIITQRLRDIERNKVMNIQKMCRFPLRPNEPLRDVAAKARIQDLKNGASTDSLDGDGGYPR